ncbi:hypothetical protein WI84_32485 [Burkholderia ubonensis]|nr:hypothetical protein WI79_02995 [Burkholderia ubonensis]KVD44932.1 hypothetical protein WI84_32485 [Burkholderia ubonensis]KVD68130.1 hypothetical protein WI87_27890 [Burkholderia ubonensis]KVR35990.1 hypothetical protein WK13_16800 [Burkholderia ubonensis]KVT57354.1 hypothetical protein WK54_14575 [Burkholderia ubonensis]
MVLTAECSSSASRIARCSRIWLLQRHLLRRLCVNVWREQADLIPVRYTKLFCEKGLMHAACCSNDYERFMDRIHIVPRNLIALAIELFILHGMVADIRLKPYSVLCQMDAPHQILWDGS